jgi:23S rRNA (uridine2552-2'-O)-methyltransferase
MKTQTKSKKVNKAWLHDHVTDPYVRLAQKEGFRARAAYKLKELDEAFHLVRPGQVVVDLGAAPGPGASTCDAASPQAGGRVGLQWASWTAPSSRWTCWISSRSKG